MNSHINIYNDFAHLYLAKGFSPLPIVPSTKRPVGEESAKKYAKRQMTEKQLQQNCQKYPDHNIGLPMGIEFIDGYILVAIDVDYDPYMAFVERALNLPQCSKRGSKGATYFVHVESSTKNSKWKPEAAEGPILEVLGGGLQTVVPPSIHPATGTAYTWRNGKSLLDADISKFPIISGKRMSLIAKIIKSPQAWEIVHGGKTHDAFLTLTSSGITQLEESDESLYEMLIALLPKNYEGNIASELMNMIKTAREKKLGWSRNAYDPGSAGPMPLGYTADSHYVFIDGRRLLKVISPSSLLSKAGLLDMAPLNFWLEQFPQLRGKQNSVEIDITRAGNALMEACRMAGPFIPGKIRGKGVFREGSTIVPNLGHTTPISKDYVYVCFDPLPELSDSVPADPAFVLDFLKSFNWKNPKSADLLFGCAVFAPVCGALIWRTHIFVCGAPGVGKSKILDGLRDLMEPLVVKYDGKSTAASIRQRLNADSLPVIMDEFEPNGQHGHIIILKE